MKYIVPQISPNDESVKIIDVYFKNGQYVNKGEIIAVLESTKAAVEVEAEISEKIFYNVKKHDSIKVGSVLAEQTQIDPFERTNHNVKNIKYTEAALKLIKKEKLDIKKLNFKKLIVKESDILQIIEKTNSPPKKSNKILKYPLLDQYTFQPVASLSFNYDNDKDYDLESDFWEKIYNSLLSEIVGDDPFHTIIYNGSTLLTFPISKQSSLIEYRNELNQATLEVFRGKLINGKTPNLCVSYLKSELDFQHIPLLFPNTLITIGVAQNLITREIKVNIVYDHRYLDGYNLLNSLKVF